MKDKTLTDILVICKGWYNCELYKNQLEALNAYYHKYYGCEDVVMDKGFATYLFLQPLVIEAIKINPTLARHIFESNRHSWTNKEPFEEVMYDRLLGLIHMIERDTFDLSEYEDMFKKAKDCNYTDRTIGII